MAGNTNETRPLHRIAKLLARAGVASRREIERMVDEGRIARDGVTIDTPATLLPSLHGVTVDGNPVAAPAPARLFLFHKPVGLLTTERDPGGRPTIYDRLPRDLPRLVPVGRLDLNTEGLLLMTTDGALKRQLELPATGVERTYRARAYGAVTQAQLEELIEGIEIDGIRYGGIDANLERRTGANVWIEMTLTEGKNREVRRVLEHLGLQVGRLIRTRYGPFVLGDLPAGGIGEVRAADLVRFRQTLDRRGGEMGAIAVTAQDGATRQRAPRATAGDGEMASRPAERASRAAASRGQMAAPGQRAARPGNEGERSAQPTRSRSRSAGPNARGRDTTAPRERTMVADRTEASRGGKSGASHPSRPRAADTGTTRTRGDGEKPARVASPPTRGKGAADNATSEQAATGPRAPMKRKAGWAKPKPKPRTGPVRPKRR